MNKTKSTKSVSPKSTAVLAPERQELLDVAKDLQVQDATALQLLQIFAPYADQAHELVKQSAAVNDVELARAYRLKLRQVRIGVEDARKRNKEDSLRQGRAVDGMANVLKFLIEPAEERLYEIERAEEITLKKKQDALIAERESRLKPFGVDPIHYRLGEMPEEAFLQLLNNSRVAHEEKVKRETGEAERQRLENERLRKEQVKRDEELRVLNERLTKERAEREQVEKKAKQEKEAAEAKTKKERDAQEEKARKEREQAAAKLKAEQEKTAALQRQQAQAKEAEEARLKKEQEAQAKAERAPDKEKLKKWLNALKTVPMPEMITKAGKQALFKNLSNPWKNFIAAVEVEIDDL